MNILSMLQQLLGSGCSGGTCSTAAQTAASVAGSMGGLPDIFTTICRLFGFGC